MMNFTLRLLSGLLASSVWILAGCNSDTNTLAKPAPKDPAHEIIFSHTKMEEVTFNHFVKTDEGLYAATSAGIFQLKDQQWENLTASQQWEVIDLETLGAGHLLASVKQQDSFHLAESTDSGVTWHFVASNFGQIKDEEGSVIPQSISLEEKIQALEYDHEIGMLYGTGFNVLAISADHGRTWSRLSGEWQGFATGYAALTIDFNSFKIWFGGQNAIEQSRLLSFDISLLETKIHDSMTDMTNEPGTVKNISFHPTDADTIFAAGEPGIISTTDSGETWDEFYINAESRFYFGLLINPDQPDTMYTSGWDKAFFEPQPFYLELTTDGGTTWQKIAYTQEANIFGGVWSMHAEYGQQESTLYFGLYKGGVMTVTVKN